MAGVPSFRDFQEFEYLHHYEDFVNKEEGDADFEHGVAGLDHLFYGGVDGLIPAENEKDADKTSIIRKEASSDSDVILKALTLADARKCDECEYPFSEMNGPEVFSGCGHMVCKSCFVWCYDFNKGSCAQCYRRGQVPIPHIVESTTSRIENNGETSNMESACEEKPKFIDLMTTLKEQKRSTMAKWNEFLAPPLPPAVKQKFVPPWAGIYDQRDSVSSRTLSSQVSVSVIKHTDEFRYEQLLCPVIHQTKVPAPTCEWDATPTIQCPEFLFDIKNEQPSYSEFNYLSNQNIQNYTRPHEAKSKSLNQENKFSNLGNYSLDLGSSNYGHSSNSLTLSCDSQFKHKNSGSKQQLKGGPNKTLKKGRKEAKKIIKYDPYCIPTPVIIRSQKTPEDVIVSFPRPVQFIMKKNEPVAPGSPDKKTFIYSITADSVAVKVDQNTPTSNALDFLKSIEIKSLGGQNGSQNQVEKSMKGQQQNQKQNIKRVKQEETNGDIPIVFIGTQGQIKRAVKRDIQKPLSNSSSPNQNEFLVSSQAQQSKRRVVLLPNLSQLNRFNLINNNNKY